MAHRDWARQDITADLGVHRRSVNRWLNTYWDGGLGALRPRTAKGTVALGQGDQSPLAENAPIRFKRLPSYDPQRIPIERVGKKLKRSATHYRLFDTLADLKPSIRTSLSYFQTVLDKVRSMLQSQRTARTK